MRLMVRIESCVIWKVLCHLLTLSHLTPLWLVPYPSDPTLSAGSSAKPSLTVLME